MWSQSTTDHLKYAVAPSSSHVQVVADQQGLCDLIGAPPAKHVILQVYTAAASEEVIAYECADGKVKVVRGDVPKPWPAGACVRVVQIVDGSLCVGGSQGDEDRCGCAPAWDALSVCDAFTLDLTNPLAPSLCLRPTGVVAGDYCGFRVDAYGRIVSVDENFPVACLPVFDPCACADSGGGSGPTAPAAADVLYAGQIGACAAVGPTVQSALEQVDSVLCGLQNQQAASVVAGNGVSVTSAGATYTVALQPVGLPGTYDGVSVNAYGQVVGVNIPSPAAVSVAGTAPVSVLQTGAASFTVSVGLASYASPGVVKLAPAPGSATPDPDDVVSWSTLGLWWANTQNYTCSLPNAGEVAPAGLPALSLLVCNNGAGERMTARDAIRSLGGAVAYYSNQGGSVSLFNLQTVGAWAFQIIDAPARYSVVVEPSHDGGGNPLIPKVAKVGPQFTLTWYDLSGALVPAGPAEASVLIFRV